MMENVIEKHYVPTSGSGLDANLVAALMNNNNKSLDPATVALLRDNDKGLETAALANGGGMFGGAAMWNNPFMYLVWMWMMRWMNGNGEWGNGQGLANQLNNDANTNLTIRAIDGNRDALRELATNLNCDFNTLNSAICGIKGAIDPPLKPGEFRNPNIPVEKIMSIRVEVFGNVLEYTVPANATSVKDGDTEIYLRRDDLETKLKSQVDSYRIMFESVNKQKQLYEKYNDLFQSVKGNPQENVTEEKYKELIARIAELEEQLKEKEQPKE